MKPAIFLDRDGVIIENLPNYVRSWADVVFIPASIHALVRLAASPYKIIIVTNQSAVGRGLMSLKEAVGINERLVHAITQAGGRIDDVFICPHAPDQACNCRKPEPGLLEQAKEKHTLDMHGSFMIGDAWTDLLAGWRAGVRRNLLVQTGRGVAQSRLPVPEELRTYQMFASLAAAVDHILESYRP